MRIMRIFLGDRLTGGNGGEVEGRGEGSQRKMFLGTGIGKNKNTFPRVDERDIGKGIFDVLGILL